MENKPTSASKPPVPNGTSVKAVNVLLWVIVAIVAFVLVLLVFSAGIWVGQERARFSFTWADNYHKNFGGPMGGFFGDFPNNGFINGHGLFGSIIKIDADTLIIKDAGNTETTVKVLSTTSIRNTTSMIHLADLKPGENVVVIGSPDSQGEIEAAFIRTLPANSPVSDNFDYKIIIHT